MDTGLARRQRILSPLLFRKIMNTGRSFAGRYLVAWVKVAATEKVAAKSNQDGDGDVAATMLGVVASKKTFRRAVDRNRAKRLLREAFRLNRGALADKADVVLLARGRILSAKRQEVEADFRDVMRKLCRG